MSTVSSANFTDGNILLKECTQTINNNIKLHILGVPMTELGNWLIHLLQWDDKWRHDVGTRVVEGIGKMVVTAVGVNSAKGVICNLLGLSYNSVCIAATTRPNVLPDSHTR